MATPRAQHHGAVLRLVSAAAHFGAYRAHALRCRDSGDIHSARIYAAHARRNHQLTQSLQALLLA